jgi:hypothetical protein
MSAPADRARSATSTLACGLTLLLSTQTLPTDSPASMQSGSPAICYRAGSSVTMVITTSTAAATSLGVSFQRSPSGIRGRALAAVQLVPDLVLAVVLCLLAIPAGSVLKKRRRWASQ